MNKIAYKGFNKDWTCRNFQYEVGKSYKIDDNIEMCKNGFHCCENPTDVFNYYNDIDGKYAEVIILGKHIKENDKTVTAELKITKELSFWDIFKLNMKIVVDLCVKSQHANASGDEAHANTSGYKAHANTSGDEAHANASGDEAHANTSGDEAHANASGKNSVAVGLGYANKAKAKSGWIVLTEYDNEGNIIHIKTGKVGKHIKSDVWYELKNNKFVVVK
jgi:hypothetical protein